MITRRFVIQFRSDRTWVDVGGHYNTTRDMATAFDRVASLRVSGAYRGCPLRVVERWTWERVRGQ